MIRILQVCPSVPDHVHRMAAEILACCDTDPHKRTEHRRAKLATFPEADRDAVRAVVNRVIEARIANRRNIPCSN